MTGDASAVHGIQWSDLPLQMLRDELRRRQDERPVCGTKGGLGPYNLPLHVFALFLILALSTGACSFPILVKRIPQFPVPHMFLFLSRHFGTGVLIATAFVHLLPTAFSSLTDPCLPPFWNDGYPAMAGLIAMTAVFVVVGIEMFFASKGAGHSHGDFDSFGMTERTHTPEQSRRKNGKDKINRSVPSHMLHNSFESSENLIERRTSSILSPLTPTTQEHQRSRKSEDINDDDDDEDSNLDLDPEELNTLENGRTVDATHLLSHSSAHQVSPASAHGDASLSEAEHQKQLLQCLLLEAGILFHSVFIGMAVSVATGTSFVVLLVAISFHQTFEGFALGSRISAIRFPAGSLKPWLMALAYGTTTPIGQAIGLGVHNLYDPASQTGLLMVGFMNAISSGLLLFAGLVELLAEDFLSDNSYITLKGKRRLHACSSVVCGAALMALVGAWA